jgi:hypothetical protein
MLIIPLPIPIQYSWIALLIDPGTLSVGFGIAWLIRELIFRKSDAHE